MSQDIRSFFVRNTKENDKKAQDLDADKKKRSRKLIILDSDSDEEPSSKVSKKTPNKKSPKATPDRKKLKDKVDSSLSKSKYFEVTKASALELFGITPIKRIEQPKNKVVEKKAAKIEFNDGDDFLAALNQMEDEDEDVFKTVVTKQKPTESPSPKMFPKEFESRKRSSAKPPSRSPSKSQTKSPAKSQTKPPAKSQTKSPANSPSKSPFIFQKSSPVKSPKKEVESPSKSPAKRLHTAGGKTTSLDDNAEKKKRKISLSPTPEKRVSPVHTNGSLPVGKKKIKLESPEEEQKPTKGKNNKEEGEAVKEAAKRKGAASKRPEPKWPEPTPAAAKTYALGPKAELWVDKYKPTTLKQIIGQQGEKSGVNKLVKWLRDWHRNQSGSKKLTKPSPWAKDDSGAYFKAALLSGPPGVGKTTTAHLVCKELDFDIVEFNASDTRSKKLLDQEVSELLSTKSLSQYVHGDGEVSKKHALVMDEVDGMAGNEDRGGVQQLITLIKSSKVPVICMCNDRNHPKIRSLANYCFDLRFNKPRVEQIKGAMMSICFKEKLKIKPETLAEIVTSTNQDIRLVLNHLSMLAARDDGDLEMASKHVKLGPWDVVKKVFSESDHKGMSIYDKSDLFFHDYSIAPLFVHENYLIVSPHSQKASTKRGKMELFAKVASSLCSGDLVESAIRSKNAWSLLPVQAVFSSLVPGEVLEGHVGGMINFPSWFGKNSRRGKLDRLSQEVQAHTRLRTSGGKETIRLDYARPLRDRVLGPLLKEGSEGVQGALSVLHEYHLLREDIEGLTELSAWPGAKDPMASVDSKVKAAFTRAYNKAPVLTPFSVSAPVKKGRATTADTAEDWQDEDELPEEEDNDDITADAMIMVKKKKEKNKPSAEAGTSKVKPKPKGAKKGKK